MPIYYRGAGPGSYWALHNARLTGFTSQAPGIPPSHHRLIHHITKGTASSPYISLTKSFGVAKHYAINSGTTVPVATAQDPGFVYEVELSDPLPLGLLLLDPVREVSNNAPGPLAPISYQHDGPPDFLLGVINPRGMGHFLTAPYVQPPPAHGTPRPPTLTLELESLIRALRDAEIVAVGNIPAGTVVNRYSVF